MTELFLKIVNMSISAGWLIFAVLLLRLLIRRFPKWAHMLLWGIVGLKLVNPFSIESALSLIPSSETISPEIMVEKTPTIASGIENVDKVVNPIVQVSFAPAAGDSANPLQILISVSAIVWIIGAILLFGYMVVSYCRLYKKVNTAVMLQENIFQSENINSPFVFGIFRPKIYLPFAVPSSDIRFIVSHERMHIKRHDYWWKPIGFMVLAIHWFNPFVWLSYILLCRDIELACDEKVIMNLDNEHRADYSQALLSCSTSHRIISACPLAFGEIGVKERVMSIMKYKKPTFWILILAGIVAAIVAVCFLTDPVHSVNDDPLTPNSVNDNLVNSNNDVVSSTYPPESTNLLESDDSSEINDFDEKEESSESVNWPDDSSAATAEWGSGDIYDGTAPIIRKMGEELRLNALPRRKQTEEPPLSTEVFGLWEGEMSFTVTSAELFNSIEETGLNRDDFSGSIEGYEQDGYKPLVIKMNVKNISAKTIIDVMDGEPYIFYSGGFILSCKEEFSPENFIVQSGDECRVGQTMANVYADPHSDGADYWFYTLKEGESVELTLCFFADTSAVPHDEWYLEIITGSNDHRFGFELDQLKGLA